MSDTPRTDVLRGALESALREILESAECHEGLSDRFRSYDAERAGSHSYLSAGYYGAYAILENALQGVRFDDFAGLERERAQLLAELKAAMEYIPATLQGPALAAIAKAEGRAS